MTTARLVIVLTAWCGFFVAVLLFGLGRRIMESTLTGYADLDADLRHDSDASTLLSLDDARDTLWAHWCALLPSQRARFLAEQTDDDREWLLHQAEIAGAVAMLAVESLARPVDAGRVAS